MSAIRLSICIPVHNFGPFLGPTLESIVHQAGEEVETLVLDGGSTDETPSIMQRYERDFPRVRYHRLPAKGGIDRDLARAVALARGEYCWLLSGDDLARPGAVSAILAELVHGCDVTLVESMLCRFDMTPIAPHGMLSPGGPRTYQLAEPRERLEYFRRARNTAAFFSFCSALIVKKASWDAAPVSDAFVGTCWAHAARLLSLIPRGLTVRYLPAILVDKRGDNDSFMTSGLTRRFAIAIDGYHRIADTFFGHESAEARCIRSSLRNELSLSAWAAARLDVDERRPDEYPEFRRLVRKQYADASWRKWEGLALELVPPTVLRLLKRLLVGQRTLRRKLLRGSAVDHP